MPAPTVPTITFPDTMTPFRYFCQRVLPAVYDDSLSYYELLCKIADYLNKTMSNVNELNTDVQQLDSWAKQLQEWVDAYFDDLNVQEEINNKLDQLVENGTLQEMVDSVFQVLTQEIQGISDDLTNISNNAVMKNGSEQVTWGNLSQDVKDKLQSGSAPVLEPNSVNTSNIIDGAVKFSKLNSELQNSMYFNMMETFEADLVGGCFNGDVGEEPSVVLVNSFNRGIVNVDEVNISPLDTIIFSAGNLTSTWGGYPQFFFVDSSGKIIYRYDIPANNTNRFIPEVFTIPYNCAAIYFNTPTRYPYASFGVIESFGFYDERISDALTTLSNPLAYDKITDLIYTWSGWGNEVTGYHTYAYKVNPGEKLRVKGKLPPDDQFNGGIFWGDIPDGIDSALVAIGNATPFYSSDYTSYDMDVIVPSGANWMTISNNNGAQEVRRYVIAGGSGSSSNLLEVTFNSGVIKAVDPVTKNGMAFTQFGGNNLFMPRIFITNGNERTVVTDTFPAPYIVKAVNNANGDRTSDGFTGGNHAYNNDATGTPTAEMVSLVIKLDGRIVNEGQVLTGKILEIESVNLVQATNTCLASGGGRNVLRETIRYVFDGNTLKVSNTIVPLEDIIIVRYYGIQMSGFANNEYTLYADDVVYQAPVSSPIASPNHFVCPHAWVGKDEDGCITVLMHHVGLGTYEWATSPNIAYQSSNKAYYACIYGDKNFDETEVLFISGEYRLGTIERL